MFKKFKCKLVFLIFFTIFAFLPKQKLHAAQDFELNSSVSYLVTQEGKTFVQHQINFTNKTENLFVTQYQITLGSTRLTDIWAKDNLQNLEPEVKTGNNTTTIILNLKQKAIGLNRSYNLQLGYEDRDITTKTGRVWEVNIPKPNDIEKFNTYTTELIVPSSFETPVQVVPNPTSSVKRNLNNTYIFNKSSLAKRGITALFGTNQAFSFDLRYTLRNDNPIRNNISIALPPDTAYQKLFYHDIKPVPDEIISDADGNWIANYNLNSGQKIEVKAIGSVVISLSPNTTVFQQDPSLDQYLTSQEPWQTDDPEIINLANKLKTAENIYNFIVDHLDYNYDRVEKNSKRLGAKQALANPELSICMEFTDLFVALSRAAGIPARELNGFAFTQNSKLRPLSLKQDILHAWPEYFDKERETWIPVDPTWAKTTQGIDYFSKFDLNHFVFVIHGTSSTTPYPVGFYKLDDTVGKDVNVEPLEDLPTPKIDLDVKVDVHDSTFSLLNSNVTVSIANKGTSALYNKELNIRSEDFDILSPNKIQIPILIPYSKQTLPLSIKFKNFPKPKSGRILLEIAEQTYEKELTFNSFTNQAAKITIYLVLAGTLITAAFKTGSLLLSRRKK